MSNLTSCFLIENGSDTIKYGYSTSEKPQYLLTNYFLNRTSSDETTTQNEISISKRGIIKNWNELEKLYDKIFKLENEQLQNSILMYIIEPTNSFIDKEKFCQLMFEKYSLNAINISNQALLSLISHGLVNGCVLNSGNSYSTAVSIGDNSLIKHSIEISNVAGSDITYFLMKNLNLPDKYKNDYSLHQSIKEKYCQIVNEGDDLKQFEQNIEYELPDGNKINLEWQKLNMAANIPFETYLVDCDLPNVQDILFKSISKTQIDFRKTLYSNIILTGGNTMCKGFVDRFRNELKQMVPKTIRTKIIAERNRKHSAWCGAKILADLNSFHVITKQDYEDAGSKLITKIFP